METEQLPRLRQSWENLPKRAERISARDRKNKYFSKEKYLCTEGDNRDRWHLKYQMTFPYDYLNDEFNGKYSEIDFLNFSIRSSKFVHALKYFMERYESGISGMLALGIEFAETSCLGKREIKKVVQHLKKESERMYESAYKNYKSWIGDTCGVGAPAHLKEYENYRMKIDNLEKLLLEIDRSKE